MEVKRQICCLCLFFSFVAGQLNQVQINVTSPIHGGINDLVINCHAEGSYHHIFSYTIHKNGTSGFTPVVRQYYSVESSSSSVKTEWFISNFESRALLSGTPLPSPIAAMKMTIPANKVNMATDEGEYQCDFVATQSSGKYPITHSDIGNILILPGPTGQNSPQSTTPTSTAGQILSRRGMDIVALLIFIYFVL